MGVGPSLDASGVDGASAGNKEFKSMVAAGCNGGIGVGNEVPAEEKGSSDVGVACEFCGG